MSSPHAAKFTLPARLLRAAAQVMASKSDPRRHLHGVNITPGGLVQSTNSFAAFRCSTLEPDPGIVKPLTLRPSQAIPASAAHAEITLFDKYTGVAHLLNKKRAEVASCAIEVIIEAFPDLDAVFDLPPPQPLEQITMQSGLFNLVHKVFDGDITITLHGRDRAASVTPIGDAWPPDAQLLIMPTRRPQA